MYAYNENHLCNIKCGMRLTLNEKEFFKDDTTKFVFIHLCNKLAQMKCQAIKGFIHVLNS